MRKWRNVTPRDVLDPAEHLAWLRSRYAVVCAARDEAERKLALFDRRVDNQPVRLTSQRERLANRLYAARRTCRELLHAIARFDQGSPVP